MAKKKEQTNDDKSAFNIDEALDKLERPRMFVVGLKEYVKDKEIKSEKDLEKIIKEFEGAW